MIYCDAHPPVLTRHVLLGRPLTELCFMHHFSFWTRIISRIYSTQIYKSFKDSDWQSNVKLVQSVRHQSRSQEVLDSIPTWNYFLVEFILLFPVEAWENSIDSRRLSSQQSKISGNYGCTVQTLAYNFLVRWLTQENVGIKRFWQWPLKLFLKRVMIYHGKSQLIKSLFCSGLPSFYD